MTKSRTLKLCAWWKKSTFSHSFRQITIANKPCDRGLYIHFSFSFLTWVSTLVSSIWACLLSRRTFRRSWLVCCRFLIISSSSFSLASAVKVASLSSSRIRLGTNVDCESCEMRILSKVKRSKQTIMIGHILKERKIVQRLPRVGGNVN